MPLLDDSLTIWEIGFRWAGLNPENPLYYLYLPLAAKDNFRLLLSAIENQDLYCGGLTTYPSPYHPEGMLKFHAKDVNACIEGERYNRKFLQLISIQRREFAQWCDNSGIPYPEFWFPSGWLADEPGYPASLRKPANAPKEVKPELPSTAIKPSTASIKRDQTKKNWSDLIVVAEALRAKDNSLTIAEAIRQIKSMSHLQAAATTEGAIRKHIAHLWPPEAKKPGRKPAKLS